MTASTPTSHTHHRLHHLQVHPLLLHDVATALQVPPEEIPAVNIQPKSSLPVHFRRVVAQDHALPHHPHAPASLLQQRN